jgi:putative addiction module component (TIGR02574 family)
MFCAPHFFAAKGLGSVEPFGLIHFGKTTESSEAPVALPLPEIDVDQLTVEQRLELIGRLWDSIPDTVDEMPLPEWHREELERRLADADANPGSGISWEDVKKQLRNKS